MAASHRSVGSVSVPIWSMQQIRPGFSQTWAAIHFLILALTVRPLGGARGALAGQVLRGVTGSAQCWGGWIGAEQQGGGKCEMALSEGDSARPHSFAPV